MIEAAAEQHDTTDSDEALLAAIAGGSEAAMEKFYRRHAGAVCQFALRTVQNSADAAEIMNEVMLEVWRKAASFAGQSKVRTWLFSVTHHKAVDAVRRKARHDHHDEVQEDSAFTPACSLDDARAGAEDAQRVQRCLGELRDGHRQVVYLTFFEGLAYPEIAGILSIPEGTVKTRMMHAKKQLQACLARLLARPLSSTLA